MGRGRKRKFNRDIPAHIDQDALPQGIYWSDNRWYLLEPHPEGGRPRKRTVGGKDARLSELHAAVEAARGGDLRGSLDYLCAQFKKSSEYLEKADETKRDYDWCADTACNYVLADGSRLGEVMVARLTVPAIQRLVEALGKGREATGRQPALPARPSKANHVQRFLRRTFAWGIRFGLCQHNPAKGVRQMREVGNDKMPTPQAFATMLDFLKARGRLKAHTRGSVSPYLYYVLVLAYNLRLRKIEVTDLTDAHELPEGVLCNRRKGSRDNVTQWNAELREAWDWLVEYRRKTMKDHKRPIPMKPEKRKLLVSQSGTPLTRSALDSAWQRAITKAMIERVIAPEDRFSLHGLKHRGVTDTAGNIGDKQDAAGHVERKMTLRYDHDLPVVAPPTRPIPKDG